MKHSIAVVGNIGSAPKFDGDRCNFSVAVYAGKDKHTDEKLTEWFSITAWDDMAAEMREYDKGDRVMVAGRLSTWIMEKDNSKQFSITCDHIEKVAFQPPERAGTKKAKAEAPIEEFDLDDDLF
jgi:single-stranded DNA-binding protein